MALYLGDLSGGGDLLFIHDFFFLPRLAALMKRWGAVCPLFVLRTTVLHTRSVRVGLVLFVVWPTWQAAYFFFSFFVNFILPCLLYS